MLRLFKRSATISMRNFAKNRFLSIESYKINSILDSSNSWNGIYRETKQHIETIRNHDKRLAEIADDLLIILDTISSKEIVRGQPTSVLTYHDMLKKDMDRCQGSYNWRKNTLDENAPPIEKEVSEALSHINNLFEELNQIIYPTCSSKEQRSFGL